MIHPEELERGNEAEQLASIAADAERWQIAHLIGFASLLAICAAVLGLAWVVRRSQPRLGLWARRGGPGRAARLCLRVRTRRLHLGRPGGGLGPPGIDPATIQTAFGEVQESGWALPYYALAVLGFVGGLLALAGGSPAEVG